MPRRSKDALSWRLYAQIIECQFGRVVVASTQAGICYCGFVKDHIGALDELRKRFPSAIVVETPCHGVSATWHEMVRVAFTNRFQGDIPLDLEVCSTVFQRRVWNALCQIPFGTLSTYGKIASDIGAPGASRAVGTAIGKNPVACIIPCHRVICSNGQIGNYHWGSDLKRALIEWEQSVLR